MLSAGLFVTDTKAEEEKILAIVHGANACHDLDVIHAIFPRAKENILAIVRYYYHDNSPEETVEASGYRGRTQLSD